MQFQFKVNGDIPDGAELRYEKVGTPINGKQRDLIITVRMDTCNGMYQRNGSDIIQIVPFQNQYKGYKGPISLSLPDGTQENVYVEIEEGYERILEGKGMMKTDGSRGNLIIKIHLG